METLIRKAMEYGQFHVATTYIKKLRLRERFTDELAAIEKAQQTQLLEFRQYAQLRLAQFEDPTIQKNLHSLLGAQAEDEMVELEPVEVEIVLSEEQEIFPRKKKAKQPKQEEEGQTVKKEEQTPATELSQQVEEQQQEQQQEPNPPAESAGQSRFGFARASSPPPRPFLVPCPGPCSCSTSTHC